LKQNLYKLFSYKFQVPSPHSYQSIMSDCGNCDCSDKSQCVKKGSSYTLVIETEKISYMDAVAVDAPEAEHDGKCKCGSSCACVNCACGH
ncbi:hypothetical protein, partial [Latilactobacillus sakei]|uniref:hypothetical protein n=1 Tax=Latilactobacillus sakei TaxID=1599 RepID=UPI003F52E3B5